MKTFTAIFMTLFTLFSYLVTLMFSYFRGNEVSDEWRAATQFWEVIELPGNQVKISTTGGESTLAETLSKLWMRK